MNNTENLLDALTQRAMRDQRDAHLRSVIQKELLHYDILYCMEQERLLDGLVFQGGTSLRLCHGADRYSEDLDFVGGRDFSPDRLAPLKGRIEAHIDRRYGLEAMVKEPARGKGGSELGGLKIDRWQVAVVTDQVHRDVPRQRVKIEIANIPAYTSEVRNLQANYEVLPDGYADVLVVVESLDEVVADKLVALAASQKVVRHRDIWDLAWLRRRGAVLRTDLVRQKIADYGVEGYAALLDSLIERAPSIVAGRAFHDQMKRFLPEEGYRRSFGNPNFERFLTRSIGELCRQLKAELALRPSADQLGR